MTPRFTHVLLASLVAAYAVRPACAQFVWTGQAGSAWSSPGSWAPQGPPPPGAAWNLPEAAPLCTVDGPSDPAPGSIWAMGPLRILRGLTVGGSALFGGATFDTPDAIVLSGAAEFVGSCEWQRGVLSLPSDAVVSSGVLRLPAEAPVEGPRVLAVGVLRNRSEIHQLAPMVTRAGATIRNEGSWLMAAALGPESGQTPALFDNFGSNALLSYTGAGNGVFSLRLNNSGEVRAATGTFTLAGPIDQLQGATLAGGVWNVRVGATLSTAGRSITAIGPGALVSTRGMFTEFRPRSSDGIWEIGINSVVIGSFTNRGSLQLRDGAQLLVAGEYLNSPGGVTEEYYVDSYHGSGIVASQITNHGFMDPGGVGLPGIFHAHGSFVQASDGEVRIELAGDTPVIDHDQLWVHGTSTLAGTLRVIALPGYTPSTEILYHFFTGTGAYLGNFEHLVAENFPPGLAPTIVPVPGGLAVQVVEVPVCDPDLNQDGNADQDDVAYLINVIAGGPNPAGTDPDFNRDGNVDQDDMISLVDVVAGSACP